MPKFITAEQWRNMTTEQILQSIDVAIQVVSKDRPINSVHAYRLSSLVEDIAPLIRKFFDCSMGWKAQF